MGENAPATMWSFLARIYRRHGLTRRVVLLGQIPGGGLPRVQLEEASTQTAGCARLQAEAQISRCEAGRTLTVRPANNRRQLKTNQPTSPRPANTTDPQRTAMGAYGPFRVSSWARERAKPTMRNTSTTARPWVVQ
jgi:hypothetical protein